MQALDASCGSLERRDGALLMQCQQAPRDSSCRNVQKIIAILRDVLLHFVVQLWADLNQGL